MKTILFLLLLLSFMAYSADIKIPVQGYLTDNNGVALNGEQNIKFSIYDMEEDGVPLWSNQTTAIITVTDGYFSYMLGTTDFIDSSVLENDSPLYLGIKINDEVLSPRIELGVESKAVFAYKADNSNKLEGKTVSDIKNEIDNEKLNSILSRLDALETANAEKDSKITELQNKVTALETANDEKNTKIATLETKVANLEANNFSGSYNDLTDKPDFTGWDTNASDDFSGSYNDLSNKPTTITQAQSSAITQNTSEISSQDTRINNLETKTADMTIVTVNGYKTVRFSQVNLQVVNGTGATDKKVNGSINGEGLGNIIVGYNELRGTTSDNRTGYHNLIIGSKNSYSSYGGFVIGQSNTISGKYSSVSGGIYNIASGFNSSVSGGYSNTAKGLSSSINGGENNTTEGNSSSISGGSQNTASGTSSSVSGGEYNMASGSISSINGGSNNMATGGYSSVSGGDWNNASGVYSSVSGGFMNVAGGTESSISGGNSRSVSGDYDWRAGSLFEDQ